MKTKDILTIATAALVTATLTVAFHAGPLVSGSDAISTAATISKPKLVTNGIEITIVPAEGRVFHAGDEPVFELQAVNQLDQPAEATIKPIMTTASPRAIFSRLMPMPTVLWQQEVTLNLKPHETNVLTLATQTKLPPQSEINVWLAATGVSPNPKPLEPIVISNVITSANPTNMQSQNDVSIRVAVKYNGTIFMFSNPGLLAFQFSTVQPVEKTASAVPVSGATVKTIYSE